MSQLIPEHPHDAGIPEEIADESHNEGAHLLANESRGTLRAQGFTDDEIEEWAQTYIAENRTGDTESFIRWISDEERQRSS